VRRRGVGVRSRLGTGGRCQRGRLGGIALTAAWTALMPW
jgi:hypothetical protein